MSSEIAFVVDIADKKGVIFAIFKQIQFRNFRRYLLKLQDPTSTI